MNKEYTSTHIEYAEVPNYVEPKERLDGATSEFFKELGEYTAHGKEYVDSIEPEIMVANPNKTNEKEQKKKKQHKKMIQNMVYTVASVATVAVLTQTAEPDKLVSGSYLSQIVSEQKISIAGATIVFEGSGELTKEDVEEKYVRDFLSCSIIDRNSNSIKIDKVMFIYKYGSKKAKKIAVDEKLKMI